jgi:hypothetical protein
VSRTVVREALSKLQAAGLVETHHGIGTFVLQPRGGGMAGMGGPGGPGGMGGMGGMGGPGGRGGHRRTTLGRHASLGPDYDWFDDDEEEEMAGAAGGGAASGAPATSGSAPAK